MKILAVDDEEDMQTLFMQRFRNEIRSGVMEFYFASSAPQALEVLDEHQHQFVLILSDINMPGMSGLELLSQIKKKYNAPPPKVFMITAYGDDNNYNMAMSLGADDFITKPLDFTLLKDKLKNTV
ncbi:MAG: response regulator [Bacteroidetes bacterium]|jgi:CheY-like chemotaxis protein|nr:response regulator [Bacteroidota bacterium]MCO5278753.1 response regulator [Saprospiraceae bacterium]HMT76196.1 response regulator [Saprospiraceae bacterium]HQU95528.1 response regulator [Saprospiraceae bacterium]HQW96424.1 response regulator [Saprospiraceae bacterium]